MTADGFSLTKSELLPVGSTEGFDSAETLAGKLLNSVYNAISSDAALSFKERKERAVHSDQLATIMADTVAMLPGLRMPVAGLLRATALTKSNGTWSNLSANFGKDFVEGVALNRVSAYCLPDGMIGKQISSRLGKGILADSASFATTGAGIASVSTGFRTDSWFDENKNFSVTHGGMEILKAGTTGGALSVPAGLLASRISRLGLSLGAEGKISTSTALAVSGLGSGYFSGAVLGGVQGVMAGGDYSSVLRAANEGGVAAALSGAIGLSALVRLQGIRHHELPNARGEEVAYGGEVAKNSVVKEPRPERPAAGKVTDLELWKSLEIKANKLLDPEQFLADRVAKLGKYVSGDMRYFVAGESGEQIAAVSKSFEEFVAKGGMRLVTDRVRIYGVGNGVTITIPESYASKLDQVLNLRLKAAEDPQLYTKGPDYAREVLQAQIDLEAHPLKDHAHPADFVHLIEELPDRRLVKDLFIREDRSPSDAWSGKEYEKAFRAVATAGKEDSRITVYGQKRSPLLREYIKHEWGHLLKWAVESDSQRFDQAALLEKDGFYVSEYSKRNHEENWAEHLSSLLDPDPDSFRDTAHGAPLRTVELGRALMKSLSAGGRGQPGIHQEEIANRLAYIQNHVMPEAQNLLMSQIAAGGTENAVTAARLLGRLAGQREFEFLSAVAKTHENTEVRTAAFNSAWDRLTKTNTGGYAGEVFKGNVGEMRDFLISQSEPGSRSRTKAIETLYTMKDEHSRFYFDLLNFHRLSGSKLSRAISLMDRAPDPEGLKRAWKIALSAADGPDGRVNLALRALDRYPHLVSEVVDILAAEAQARTRPFMRDLTKHYNSRVAARAAEGLRKIDLNARVFELSSKISSANRIERISAAEALAATKDPRAASVILDAYVRTQDLSERELLGVVVKQHITPSIWKFEVRQKKQEYPQMSNVLDRLMR